MARISLGVLVEGFAGEHGALLDLEADFQERREGVGEVADAEGADEGGDVAEFGDGAGDDEGEGPVDGDHGDPDEFSADGGKGGEICFFVLVWDSVCEVKEGWGDVRKSSMKTLL